MKRGKWTSARASLVVAVLMACGATRAAELDRGKGWFGPMLARPGDERFERIYVEDATLYHEGGAEVALWGVNFQSAMSWEWQRANRGKGRGRSYDAAEWKALVNRGFDEIQRMGCEVIRIHLCPGDFADEEGELIENEWLDMIDYTLAECHRRGIYINFALLNHLGRGGSEAILSSKLKEHKWEAMVVPAKLSATENYIRQFANRRNPYDGDRPYKANPAWIIAELMNEPVWPTVRPSANEYPAGWAVYEDWLTKAGRKNSDESWARFKTESIQSYIDRFDRLLFDERVPAVTCWNLFWSQGPKHQGWESYDAAAKSTVPVVSFSTYPGQNDSENGIDLSERNYLPYLRRSFELADWQGWLQEDRFKGRKAAIVYEFETWHNQSSYLYPAMAKYFKAQGAQVATMWTYYLYDTMESGLGRTHSHNLNLVTTPRKAASFMVAGRVFKETRRYLDYETLAKDMDRSEHAAWSFSADLSAYADGEIVLHSGDLPADFVDLPRIPKSISGYGSSPFIRYGGKGLYHLEAVFENGRFSNRWKLNVQPHAVFAEDGRAVVNHSKAYELSLRLPGMDRRVWDVYRVEGAKKTRVQSKPPAISFQAAPGNYEVIKRK